MPATGMHGPRLHNRLTIAAALFGLVVLIGVLQQGHLFEPVDRLAMRIVQHLRMVHGAGLATLISHGLDQIGSAGGRLFIALGLGLFLGRAGRPRAILWLLVVVVGMMAVNSLVKLAFAAPRPDLLPQLAQVNSYSFPSGHASGAVTLWGGIALLFRHRLVGLFCLGMILATGLSRVWLGVHWPSDVIGGWAIGLAWLVAMSTLLPRRRARRAAAGEGA